MGGWVGHEKQNINDITRHVSDGLTQVGKTGYSKWGGDTSCKSASCI